MPTNYVARKKDRWVVQYDKICDGRREACEVASDNVILAAGSLGSTEILLRSRDEYRTLPKLPCSLGHNWSSNGDFLTFAKYKNRDIFPMRGPTITSAIDFLHDGVDGARFFVEDGGFPHVFAKHWLLKWKAKALGLRANHVMPWFGQAIDASDGVLYLGRSCLPPWKFKLKLDWQPSNSEKAINGLIAMHKKLSSVTGGRVCTTFPWSLLRLLVTPHPLGGCNMATNPMEGVVDHLGRVFNHPGLYVVDGAIIPRAIGLNPSKTIAALAERIAEKFLLSKKHRDA